MARKAVSLGPDPGCDAAGGRRRREDVNAVTEAWSARAPAAGRSFADVAAAHLDDVYAYLLYMTRHHATAEDLTSETFERALRHWRRFDGRRGSARTWLCQIARTTALDHFRTEARRRRREERTAPPERVEAPLVEGLSPALDEALGKLSAGEREVLALRVVLELDGESAARVLGISPTACSTRMSRALQKLQREMADD